MYFRASAMNCLNCAKIVSPSPGVFHRASICLLQPPRGGLPAAMEAHKVAEGDPFPLPQRPLTLLSGQTELPTLPLWRCAMCTQVWQFKLTLGPFQCRGCCICSSPQTEGIHKALEACPWHGVTYNLPKYFSRFHVIFPWFLLFFAKFHDFSRFSRCTLIFPGFPVNVGILLIGPCWF